MFYTAMTGWHWQSDWNGYEVGYPEHNVVGLYSQESEVSGQTIYIYVNTETNVILEFWAAEEE